MNVDLQERLQNNFKHDFVPQEKSDGGAVLDSINKRVEIFARYFI